MALSSANPVATPAVGPEPIAVMVVDDSAVARGLIARWVDEDPALRLTGKCSNGQRAVEAIERCAPDIVLLDVEMPVMDGLTALPLLLERRPETKVIMASTLTRRNAEISLRALSLGAVDYIPKPDSNAGITTSPGFREALIAKIRAVGKAARARVALRQGAPRPADAPGAAPAGPVALRPFSAAAPAVVAIGSSTGGPRVLIALAAAIAPALARTPVVVTQHMPATFTAILAAHLARESGCPAREARDGDPLLPGAIHVAPGGRHLALAAGDGGPRLRVYDGPEVNYCRPAVDPLFQSAARLFGPACLGVVLTGMGHDGTRGAVAIAEAGGSVIAQDEATSIVWGMPGNAAAAGACAAILPVDAIAATVNRLVLQGAAHDAR